MLESISAFFSASFTRVKANLSTRYSPLALLIGVLLIPPAILFAVVLGVCRLLSRCFPQPTVKYEPYVATITKDVQEGKQRLFGQMTGAAFSFEIRLDDTLLRQWPASDSREGVLSAGIFVTTSRDDGFPFRNIHLKPTEQPTVVPLAIIGDGRSDDDDLSATTLATDDCHRITS